MHNQARPRRTAYAVVVRWTSLFADLDARLEHAAEQERAGVVAELARAEEGMVGLVDRLRAAAGQSVLVRTADGESVSGTVAQVAGQWLLLSTWVGSREREVVVPVRSIDSVGGLGRRSTAPRDDVASRLTLGHVLRQLARDRIVVDVRTRSGTWVGRVDRVGADHLDLGAVNSWGEPVADRDPRWVTVPFSAVMAVTEAAEAG